MGTTNHTFEDILVNIQTYILANYDTYTAALNTHIGDTVSLDTLKRCVNGYHDIFAQNVYPLICLVPDRIPIEVLSMGSEDIQMILQVYLADTVGYEDGGVIKLLRYISAFRNMCTADPTFNNSVNFLTLTEAELFPPNESNLAVVQMTVEIHKEITRP